MSPKPQHVKREEAEVRQEDYEERTPEEQLRLVADRPGESRRERERLEARMRERRLERLKGGKK